MLELPNKKYNIIYADPPWSYDKNIGRGVAKNHYNVMSIDELKALYLGNDTFVWGGVNIDCILFLWSTYPKLRDSLELIEAWGFEYKTIGFQWIKQNKSGKGYFFGLGHYTRANTECCLIATKGKIKRINKSISQLIFSPIRKHSQKPDEVRDRIVELVGDLPRIELFARQKVDGWDCWGNEVC